MSGFSKIILDGSGSYTLTSERVDAFMDRRFIDYEGFRGPHDDKIGCQAFVCFIMYWRQ